MIFNFNFGIDPTSDPSFSDTYRQNIPQPLESICDHTRDYKLGPSAEFLLLERKYILPLVLPAQLYHLSETAQTDKQLNQHKLSVFSKAALTSGVLKT